MRRLVLAGYRKTRVETTRRAVLRDSTITNGAL